VRPRDIEDELAVADDAGEVAQAGGALMRQAEPALEVGHLDPHAVPVRFFFIAGGLYSVTALRKTGVTALRTPGGVELEEDAPTPDVAEATAENAAADHDPGTDDCFSGD